MEHSAGFLRLAEDARSRVRETSPADAHARITEGTGARLIDVREDHEWAQGHAAATHMSRGIIERDIERTFPDKSAELILYCGGGYRSALACDNLQKMGYTNVHSMAGGWTAWNDAELPIQQSGAGVTQDSDAVKTS